MAIFFKNKQEKVTVGRSAAMPCLRLQTGAEAPVCRRRQGVAVGQLGVAFGFLKNKIKKPMAWKGACTAECLVYYLIHFIHLSWKFLFVYYFSAVFTDSLHIILVLMPSFVSLQFLCSFWHLNGNLS